MGGLVAMIEAARYIFRVFFKRGNYLNRIANN